MEVTDALVAAIPVGNLGVPRSEFAAVWSAAERHNQEHAGSGDWWAAGVVTTCRWLAGAVVENLPGFRSIATSPVGRREVRAYEELVEAEFLAAEQLDVRCPDLVTSRPGWCEAIRTTLRWAWRQAGPAPFPLPESRAIA